MASVHWIVPIIGSSFFSIGTVLLFNSVLNYLGKLINTTSDAGTTSHFAEDVI
jgi:hypothetical protein